MDDLGVIQLLSKDILALLLKDKSAMERYGHMLDSNAFESPVHKLMLAIAKEHFETYGNVPSRHEFEAELAVRLQSGQGRHVPDEFFWEEAELVLSRQPSRDYLEDKMDEWALRRSLLEVSNKAKLLAMGEHPKSEDIEKIHDELRKARDWKTISGDRGEFVLGGMEQRDRTPNAYEVVPTGFIGLDKALGGGREKGTLGIILAATGAGKSMTLITFGVNATRARFKVLHLTLELSKTNVIFRYEAAYSKIAKALISDQELLVKERLRRIRSVAKPADVLVKEFPSGSLGVEDLRSILSNTSFWAEFKPDLLIIDYADIMKLPGGSDEKWIRQGELYVQLRGLAQEFNLALWTAVQSKKDALSKPKLRIEDLAGAVEKAQVADCIVAVCRSEDERARHEGRFYIAKNRDNIDDVTIPFREVFSQSRIDPMEERQSFDAVLADDEVPF